MVLGARVGRPTRTMGPVATNSTGVKSFMPSTGSLGLMILLIRISEPEPTSSV